MLMMSKRLAVAINILVCAHKASITDANLPIVDRDGDAHFVVVRVLGSGGYAEVDHVQSKLSLQNYAVRLLPSPSHYIPYISNYNLAKNLA